MEALGLVWELDANKVDSDSVEEGKIAKVNPSVGKKVKKGSTVKGTVSSGKKTVTVPDLTGMTQDQAREYLTQVGLQVGNVQTSDDPSQSAGKILSSSPAAGETLNKGESVSITVASGKVALPDTIVGYEQASVVASLQALTLDVSIVEEYSDTLAAGGVLSSSPSSGSIVPQGSTVHLTVSKGPKPTSPSNNSGNSGSGNGNGNG